jgi:hypothetical protein
MNVLVPGSFRNLPQPALAAVVITASLSLADAGCTVRLWRQRRVEFLLSGAAFRQQTGAHWAAGGQAAPGEAAGTGAARDIPASPPSG